MSVPNVNVNRQNLRPKDVCELLGVGIETVLSWIKSGDLEASNIGQGSRPRWLIQSAAVDAFLKSRSNKIETAPAETSRKRRSRSRRRHM